MVPRGEGPSLRRTCIGARYHVTDHPVVPAIAGHDEKVVFFSPVSTHVAEGYAETLGTDPRRFRQNFQQIAFAEGEAAKAGNGSLLA